MEIKCVAESNNTKSALDTQARSVCDIGMERKAFSYFHRCVSFLKCSKNDSHGTALLEETHLGWAIPAYFEEACAARADKWGRWRRDRPRGGGATLGILGTLVILSHSLSIKPAVCCLCAYDWVPWYGCVCVCVWVWVSGWILSKLKALWSKRGLGGFVDQLGQAYWEGGRNCLDAYINSNSAAIISPRCYKTVAFT